MKPKISPETVLRMDALSKNGASDKEIARRIGVGTNVVNMALARVAPDGHVMDSRYGHPSNNPTQRRPRSCSGLCRNEVPMPDFRYGRRRADA